MSPENFFGNPPLFSMPRNARCVLPGIPYHVTQRGTDRQRVFFLNGDREMYLHLLSRHLAGARVRVLAYALMTNHIHAVVIPERADSLAILFRRVHGRYAQYVNTRRGRSGHLWQGRFYSCPLDGAHLAVALRYVEENPCRARLVESPGQYRWSSAAVHLGLRGDAYNVLDLAFGNGRAAQTTWREMYGAALGGGGTRSAAPVHLWRAPVRQRGVSWQKWSSNSDGPGGGKADWRNWQNQRKMSLGQIKTVPKWILYARRISPSRFLPKAGRSNDNLVDHNCGNLIKGLR